MLSCNWWGTLGGGGGGASSVQVTLSLTDMNKGCSPYGEALTEETLLQRLLKNKSHGGCIPLKQDDFIKTVFINYK